jgi:hypothetical protein
MNKSLRSSLVFNDYLYIIICNINGEMLWSLQSIVLALTTSYRKRAYGQYMSIVFLEWLVLIGIYTKLYDIYTLSYCSDKYIL